MSFWGRKTTTALAEVECPVAVSVPDIKEYLVKEYQRVENLKLKLEECENKLEEASEVEHKYKATLVTLDEYSKRLKHSEELIEKEKQKVQDARREVANIRDELNSYKIMLHDAALTKEEIQGEIVFEFKNNLVENLNKVKGNLSRMIVAKIINETELKPTEKGGAE